MMRFGEICHVYAPKKRSDSPEWPGSRREADTLLIVSHFDCATD